MAVTADNYEPTFLGGKCIATNHRVDIFELKNKGCLSKVPTLFCLNIHIFIFYEEIMDKFTKNVCGI